MAESKWGLLNRFLIAMSYTTPGLFECKKIPSIIIACIHVHIFNLNVLGQCFPCSSRRGIPSPVSSLVLSTQERVFKETLDTHFNRRQGDAFKATKPAEHGVIGFELLLC